MKNVSRVFDIQKNNQLKNNFTGIPDTDMRACFNRSTWSPAMNIQQPPLGTSHLILRNILLESFTELKNLMDHYDDGIWRRHSSPDISHGGIDEPRKNSGYNDFDRHKQRFREFRRGRSSVGVDDGMPIHHAMAENKVRGCYRPLEEGTMKESSDERTTCEVWQVAMLDE